MDDYASVKTTKKTCLSLGFTLNYCFKRYPYTSIFIIWLLQFICMHGIILRILKLLINKYGQGFEEWKFEVSKIYLKISLHIVKFIVIYSLLKERDYIVNFKEIIQNSMRYLFIVVCDNNKCRLFYYNLMVKVNWGYVGHMENYEDVGETCLQSGLRHM